MKILLTHGYFLYEDAKEQQIMKPYVPLGILYIAAYLENNGYPNNVFDTTFKSFQSLKDYLLEERPDVIGIYTNLMTKVNVLKVVAFVREQDRLKHTKIVLGGPEVTNHVHNFLMYGVDIIISGEGEQTMLEVVNAIETGGDLKDIAGISYLKDDCLVTNTSRSLNKALDELPVPARDKIDLTLYLDLWKKHHGYSAINLSTMRGCPYTCKWCSRAVYGQSYRRRKPSLVVDEIVDLQKQYSFDQIWFVDDVFTISHKWLGQFAEEIEQRGVKLSYECISRADRLNDEVITLLKATGCFRVWIGAESGSQKVIDAMDRRVDVVQTREIITKIKQAGIEAGTFIMLGYPGETEEDIKETMLHLRTSMPDQFTITVTYPIKGTPLYNEVEKDFLTNFPWESSTDRDIDFQRTYPRQYYDHAVKWVVNEVNTKKYADKGKYKTAIRCKLTALKSRWYMSQTKKLRITSR